MSEQLGIRETGESDYQSGWRRRRLGRSLIKESTELNFIPEHFPKQTRAYI